MSLLALAGSAQTPLAVVLALVTASYLCAADRRTRGWLSLAVLVLAPLTLAASAVGDDEASLPQLGALTIVGAGIAGLLVLGAATTVFVRWPKVLAPAAIVTLPFRVPIAVGGLSVKILLPLYLVIAGAVLAELYSSLREPDHEPVRERRRLDIAFGVVVGLYGLQAVYSSDPDVAAQNLAFFYAPFALLYGLVSRLRWDRLLVATCLRAAVALALILTAAGFVEYLRGRYLITPGGIQPNDFDPYFRIQSLFFDPNIFGRFLAVVMALAATALLRVRDNARIAAYAVVLAVLWAGLVLTLSQSSFLALLAGLAVIAVFEWGRKLVISGAVVLAVVGVIAVFAFPSALGFDVGSERGLESTTSGRFDLVTGGADLFAQKPVFGYGSGSFSEEFVAQDMTGADGVGETSTSKSHTAPLTVAAEQGLVGLLAFLALLWIAFATLFTGARRAYRPGTGARIAVAAGFTVVFVHSLTYAALLEDPLTWLLLGSALGLAAIPRRTDAAEADEEQAQ